MLKLKNFWVLGLLAVVIMLPFIVPNSFAGFANPNVLPLGVEGIGIFVKIADLVTVTGNQTFGTIVGFTTNTLSGNMTNASSDRIGYINANFLCSSQFAGSGMCLCVEVIKDFSAGNVSITGTYWCANGPPGYTANADDCAGWNNNDSTFLGPFYNADLPGAGVFRLTNCEQEKQIACCGVAR